MQNIKPDNIIVSVIMITYDHDKYIKQAIEGVLMQICDFEIELIVANDCSPDNTDFVVNELLANNPRSNIVKYTRHNLNKGMSSNFIWAVEQTKGKYIALCEGDDYWTDHLKLQKQVDFLEENNHYNIVWTKFNKIDRIGQLIESNLPKFQSTLADVTAENLLVIYRTWTLTVVFRSCVFNNIDFSNFKYLKDNTVYFLALKNNGLGRVLDLNTANYRVHENGVWSSNTEFQNYLANYYNFREITNKLETNESIENFTNDTLRSIYRSMIGEINSKEISFSYYNNLFFVILSQLNWIDKLIFLKYYFIKMVYSSLRLVHRNTVMSTFF
jgi:glycosyltransferase involved in cell wall biosynthesis